MKIHRKSNNKGFLILVFCKVNDMYKDCVCSGSTDEVSLVDKVVVLFSVQNPHVVTIFICLSFFC